jgi:hypothetical protein
MKKLLVVLGLFGSMVCQAQAGERWPENVCKDIQGLRTILETDKPATDAVDRANQRFAVLLMQEVHCGVDVKAAQAADRRVFQAQSQPAQRPAAALRAPVFCDTTRKAYGGSTTDCF